MHSRMALYGVSLVLVFLVAACQPVGTTSTSTPSGSVTPRSEATQTPAELATSLPEATEELGTPTPEVPATLEMTETPTLTATLTPEQRISHGEEVYMAHCSACHGPAGEGSGDFPALAENTEVTALETMTMTQFLIQGQDGQHDFGDELSDREIAAVLTYIRNSWGNEGTPVTEEEVQMARQNPAYTPTP